MIPAVARIRHCKDSSPSVWFLFRDVVCDIRSINVCLFVCLFSLALIVGTSPQKSIGARREQVPFSMAIGNGELMHECFPNTRAWEQQDRN